MADPNATTKHVMVVNDTQEILELFRDIPLLVQMFLWYFVLPELLPADLGDWLKQLPNASFYTAVVALGFYTSARVAEQVRAGIQSLAGGQRMAALALGLRAFYRAQDMEFESGLRYLQGELGRVLALEDAAEGVAAFLQKRAPVWKGR